jgi:protoporphyrinogen/coproporphyrinogen III oxidase
MQNTKKHIVVIGGGLSGTAAAHELSGLGLGYEVTIIEARNRLGGRIHSHVVDSATVEMGAGFLTKDYKNLMNFLAQTGLESDLFRHRSKTAMYKNGNAHMLTLKNLATGKLLSLFSLLYILPLLAQTLVHWRVLNLHKFWKASKLDNKPVSQLFSSKHGKEFMETMLQPVLNGYFYWSPEHTSVAMMLMLCKAAFSHGTYKLSGGLQQITQAAAKESTVLLNHSVRDVTKSADGSYQLRVEHNAKSIFLSADAIVCATTAVEIPRIFPDLSKHQKEFFRAVEYSSAALIANTYNKLDARQNKSIAFPRTQGVGLSSVTLSEEPGKDAKKYSTVKVYASGSVAEERIKLLDKQLIDGLSDDLSSVKADILIGDPPIIATHTQRWPEALPYFDVGHFKRLAEFNEGRIEDSQELIAFAGDYIGGPFMEGAFTSGLEAARRLHDRLQAQKN